MPASWLRLRVHATGGGVRLARRLAAALRFAFVDDAGEAVDQGHGDGGQGSLAFGRAELASGTYLIAVRFMQGRALIRQVTVKAAVVR